MAIDMTALRISISNKRFVRNQSLAAGEYFFADISRLQADNLTAENINLNNSDLSHVNLKSCHFKSVTLESCKANNAKIRLCTFDQVSAKHANFGHAILENCKAQGCQFDHAQFMHASLLDSDFNRSSFTAADLSDADMSYCNLRGVDFREAILVNTNFCDADLRGADFSGARFENTNLSGANIDGALFDSDVKNISNNQTPVATEDINELMTVVNPVVRSILKAGSDQHLLDEAQTADELARVMAAFGSPKTSANHSQQAINSSTQASGDQPNLDKAIRSVLNQAAESGIGPLLQALNQEGGEPPLAVKKMIEGLMQDFDLGENATTEDLLTSLVSTVQKK